MLIWLHGACTVLVFMQRMHVHSHLKGDSAKTGALSFSSTMVKVHTIVLDKGVVPESLTV